MTTDDQPLPEFRYFPDPIKNGCIQEAEAECPCCNQTRPFMYVGPIYTQAKVEAACPWCIADGTAAEKLSAEFNDLHGMPDGVPQEVATEIATRTPGFDTWQTNRWLFSQEDALVFVGEVVGSDLLKEGNRQKIDACLRALQEWEFDWSTAHLESVEPGGQPAIYLFQDRQTGDFQAYADMT